MKKIIILIIFLYIGLIILLNNLGYLIKPYQGYLSSFGNKRVDIIVEVISNPRKNKQGKHFNAKALYVNGYEIKDKIYVKTFFNENIRLGEIIQLKGILVPISNSSFFKRLLYKDIYHIIKVYNFSDCNKIGFSNVLRILISDIRQYITQRFVKSNIGIAKRFVPAIILGDKSFLTRLELNAISKSGFGHILAVSGLHVTFLVILILFVLRSKNIYTYFFVLFLTSLYMALVGFSPSSIRATIMINLAFLAYLLQRDYMPLYSLCITAFIILLVAPKNLFDLSFQFSFVITFGILFLSKHIQQLLQFLPRKISKIFSISVSAQLFALPLMLIYFNKINVLAVFTNVIILPLVMLVLWLGFSCFCTSFISLFLTNLIAKLTLGLVILINFICGFVSNINWALLEVH